MKFDQSEQTAKQQNRSRKGNELQRVYVPDLVAVAPPSIMAVAFIVAIAIIAAVIPRITPGPVQLLWSSGLMVFSFNGAECINGASAETLRFGDAYQKFPDAGGRWGRRPSTRLGKVLWGSIS